MGLGRSQAAPFELRRLHRHPQELPVRHSRNGREHAWARSAPTPRRLGSVIDPNSVYYAPQFLASNDFVDNLIYRFGKNNSQRLQFFIQRPIDQADARLRRFSATCRTSPGGKHAGQCSRYPVIGSNGPVNSSQQNFVCDALIPMFPGQPNSYAFVTQTGHAVEPVSGLQVRVRCQPWAIVAADGALLAHV